MKKIPITVYLWFENGKWCCSCERDPSIIFSYSDLREVISTAVQTKFAKIVIEECGNED